MRAAALGLLILSGAAAAWAETPASAPAVDLQIGRATGPEKLVYGLFDPATGARVARLQIGRVNLEYGKHGVFRVAWKARPVLRDVELRIDDEAALPAAIGQLAKTFDSLGGAAGVVLRDVTIVRPGEAARIQANYGEVTRSGELLLPAAHLADGAPTRVSLALRGPQAGTLQFSNHLPTQTTSAPLRTEP